MGDGKPVVITSTSNPLVKEVAALQQRRARDRSSLTPVEGRDEVALALASGARPQALLRCPALGGGGERSLASALQRAGATLYELDERAFRKLAYREHPDGWLATFTLPHLRLDDLQLGTPALVLVAEGVEKPGNLGAMLRTADAAGVDAVVAADPRTDWGNPNVVRASKGALFAVPVAAAPTKVVVDWVRGRSLTPVVATPEARTSFQDANLTGPLAVVVGTEREGVSAAWRDAAGIEVAIPMAGRVNSLNVSVATALILYEVSRQRHALGPGGQR